MPDSTPTVKICGRSPCTRMVEALGRWVFGNDDGGYTAVTGHIDNAQAKFYDTITYCPFCGTHLDKNTFKKGKRMRTSS